MRTGYRAQKRGLAGAVGADQSDRLSLVDLKGHLAHGLQQSVPDIQFAD
jgi:hypothetical protein